MEQTTIARELQASLETLARDRALAIGSGVAAAILVIDNQTGEVRAHVGGTGYFDTVRAGQMDLAQALRSPGSTLKPFIYGLAFEDGLVHPETLIDDRAVRYGAYAPENFDDSFHGTVTVRTALQQSLNVPALQILNAVGPDRLMARLANAGVKLVLPGNAGPGLAVGLGGAGIRLTDLAALYVALARGGEPIPLSWQARTAAPPSRCAACSSPTPTWMIGDVLKGAPTPQNAMGGQIAFKTGTSYGYRDAWAVGYDGANTIAVWVGRPGWRGGARRRRAPGGGAHPVRGLPALGTAAPRWRLRRPARSSPAPTNCPPRCSASAPMRCPKSPAASQGDAPPAIAFPPDGARIDLDGDAAPALSLKVYGGTPPFTWLADGVPIAEHEFRRDTFWEEPPHGFARLSVIDAKGKTASARVRVE